MSHRLTAISTKNNFFNENDSKSLITKVRKWSFKKYLRSFFSKKAFAERIQVHKMSIFQIRLSDRQLLSIFPLPKHLGLQDVNLIKAIY